MKRQRPERAYFSVKDVADMLSVSYSTVDRWVKSGVIKFDIILPGNGKGASKNLGRFTKRQIDEFIKSKTLNYINE